MKEATSLIKVDAEGLREKRRAIRAQFLDSTSREEVETVRNRLLRMINDELMTASERLSAIKYYNELVMGKVAQADAEATAGAPASPLLNLNFGGAGPTAPVFPELAPAPPPVTQGAGGPLSDV